MTELYFRVGSPEGFTDSKLIDKKEGYAIPIRELLQNSLDASHEAKNKKCPTNIYLDIIPKNEIPCIDDYEIVLKEAIEYSKSKNSYNEKTKQLVESLQAALQQSTCKVLMFSDNGTGISQNQLEAMLTGGWSVKSDER